MVPLCLHLTAHSACSVDSKKVGVYLDEVLVENFVLNFGGNHEARESLVACAKTKQFESAAVAPTASILLSVASCWVNADPEVSWIDQRQTYYMRRRIMQRGRSLRCFVRQHNYVTADKFHTPNSGTIFCPKLTI